MCRFSNYARLSPECLLYAHLFSYSNPVLERALEHWWSVINCIDFIEKNLETLYKTSSNADVCIYADISSR